MLNIIEFYILGVLIQNPAIPYEKIEEDLLAADLKRYAYRAHLSNLVTKSLIIMSKDGRTRLYEITDIGKTTWKSQAKKLLDDIKKVAKTKI